MGASASDIYRATKKRLNGYAVFSEDTIEAVAQVAKCQAEYKTYQDFFAQIGVGTPFVHTVSKYIGVPVVEIAARKKAVGTVVIHLPMSNPLDENMLYHAATVAATLPEYQVIVFGNPSGAPYHYRQQTGTLVGNVALAFTKRRRALVAAEIDYLRSRGIKNAHHVGYSFGAHKAAIECSYLAEDEVASLTCLDPVSHPRRIRQLIKDFKATFAPMGTYVQRTGIQTYFDARAEAAKTRHHDKALRRPVVLALGVLMARFNLLTHIRTLLRARSSLVFTAAWGGKSELSDDARMSGSLEDMRHTYKGRVYSLRLRDDKHAFGNDIHLYAAVICESVHRAAHAGTRTK